MADRYVIRVTAGPSYDTDTHVEVPVNSPEPVHISSVLVDLDLNVRIKNYRGLPRGSPATSPYFAAEPHAYNNDQYSIAFRFTPKAPAGPEETNTGSPTAAPADDANGGGAGSGDAGSAPAKGISAHDLQFGNDFDRPIRDRLPPGFGTAMNILRWWIDPGLEGDVYADEPYLYGPALSSCNVVHAGAGACDAARGGLCFGEGGDDEGLAWRHRPSLGAPDDAKARMKWALKSASKDRWVWEYGRTYAVDFFNPYVDFNEFAVRLPGFNLPVIKYWDGQPLSTPARRSHQLRYVLRNRATSQALLVVLFTLYLKEDVNEDGSLKPAALQATPKLHGDGAKAPPGAAEGDKEKEGEPSEFDEDKAIEEARRELADASVEDTKATAGDDDVD